MADYLLPYVGLRARDVTPQQPFQGWAEPRPRLCTIQSGKRQEQKDGDTAGDVDKL